MGGGLGAPQLSMNHPSMNIAYLAPEIPSLSATFVYEELLAVERRGISVLPITVHQPVKSAAGQAQLAERTLCLYNEPVLMLVCKGLLMLPFFGLGALKALRYLLADIRSCGFSRESCKLAYQFLVGVKLARMLRAGHCRHLHVHFAHVPAQIAMYACAMAAVSFTVMAHANDIFERGLLLPEKAARAMKFLTISEFNRAYLEHIGVPAEKLAVVRCGVSFEMYAREINLMKKSCYRVGTLGRLVEKKGVDVLIRAVAAMSDRPYDIHLTIAGDGPLRNDLEQLVDNLELRKLVSFEGGLSHQEVAGWMHGLDVFVLACRRDSHGDMDGIPVVLMEAMSQFVPVISTRLSGIPELVVHRETGLLAEPDNVADLSDQMDKLFSSAELSGMLTSAAQQHVESEFGQAVNIDRLMACFLGA